MGNYFLDIQYDKKNVHNLGSVSKHTTVVPTCGANIINITKVIKRNKLEKKNRAKIHMILILVVQNIIM